MTTSRLLLAAALGVSLSCAGRQSGRTLIGAPPKFSNYEPPNALTARAGGLLGRSVFRTPESDAFRVAFDDVLVQPLPSSIPVPLDEAGIIQVRSGEGQATVAERRIELHPGIAFAVSAGERLSIQPRHGPVELRVVQIAGR